MLDTSWLLANLPANALSQLTERYSLALRPGPAALGARNVARKCLGGLGSRHS